MPSLLQPASQSQADSSDSDDINSDEEAFNDIYTCTRDGAASSQPPKNPWGNAQPQTRPDVTNDDDFPALGGEFM